MKIYFAASIKNSSNSKIEFYNSIIKYLSGYGFVLTEKIGDKNFQKERQEKAFSNKKTHDFDLKMLLDADVIIAEVSVPSLGVGYEIGRAVEQKKPVLCLCNKLNRKNISPMIAGSSNITFCTYQMLEDIKLIIGDFFGSLME